MSREFDLPARTRCKSDDSELGSAQPGRKDQGISSLLLGCRQPVEAPTLTGNARPPAQGWRALSCEPSSSTVTSRPSWTLS